MRNSVVVIISFVLMIASLDVYADSINACQDKYKTCVSELLDKYEPYINSYEITPNECSQNVKEWSKNDFQVIHCQDEYNSCIGKEGSLWNRIHNTPDIKLDIANPDDYGLSKNNLHDIKNEANAITSLRSVLIARNGKLIFEDYYDLEFEPKPHRMNSITKSITSLLIGIAIDKGILESEEMQINTYFPDYYNTKHDTRKDQITIKHALTMSTGINLSDQTYYFQGLDKWMQFLQDDNAYDWVLNKEMLLTYKPGEQWLYNTFNIDLLTSVLSSSSGMSTLEFAEEYLFKPLNIKNYAWHHDSKENYYGGFALLLRPRAILRIGQMVLDGGTYRDTQIISEEWIKKSHYYHFPLGGEEGWEYGYLWWRYRVGEYQVVSALGWGGQILALAPELDLVVSITNDSNVCSAKEQDDQFLEAMELTKSIILSIDT